jgi:hypothetical protein
VEALFGYRSDLEAAAMKRTSSRAEPVSIHLERHRDCLERHRKDRGEAEVFASGPVPFDSRHHALPFERMDDED